MDVTRQTAVSVTKFLAMGFKRARGNRGEFCICDRADGDRWGLAQTSPGLDNVYFCVELPPAPSLLWVQILDGWVFVLHVRRGYRLVGFYMIVCRLRFG